jgi:hypothetical protein
MDFGTPLPPPLPKTRKTELRETEHWRFKKNLKRLPHIPEGFIVERKNNKICSGVQKRRRRELKEQFERLQISGGIIITPL